MFHVKHKWVSTRTKSARKLRARAFSRWVRTCFRNDEIPF